LYARVVRHNHLVLLILAEDGHIARRGTPEDKAVGELQKLRIASILDGRGNLESASILVKRIELAVQPPRLGGGDGGTFANILPKGDVCQFLAKTQCKTCKRTFFYKSMMICIKNK
jgi:hypothetical protein